MKHKNSLKTTEFATEEAHFLPTGLSTQLEAHKTNSEHSHQQSQEAESNPVIEQHRLFLQNYKKERGQEIRIIRDRYFSTHMPAQYYVQEQSEHSQSQEEKPQQKSPFTEVISQKMQQIHNKIEKEIIRQPANSELRKFKIFDGVVSSKNDLERVAKERRFVRSQQEKYDYQQPEMPHKYLMPLKYRVNTQPFNEEADLAKKAREFIQKVHKEQQNLLGKQILRKKKEQFKRNKEEKEELKKMEDLNEIKKEERRLKAEQNLLLMREKLKINKIVNRNSIEELRKMLTEKQYRLEAMQESMKHTDNEGKIQKSYSISSKLERKIKRSSASDYSQDEIPSKPKHRELNISIEKLKKLQDKETNIRAKLKLGPKKHKLIRPTEYSQNSEERELPESGLRTDYGQHSEEKQTLSNPTNQRQFLNTQMNLSLKKSNRSVIANKPNALKADYLTENGNSVSITEPQSVGEWRLRDKATMQFEENTFGMMKEGRSSRQSKKANPVSSLT